MGEPKLANPASEWLSMKSWAEIIRLSDLPSLKDFLSLFMNDLIGWKALYDAYLPQDSTAFPHSFTNRVTQ